MCKSHLFLIPMLSAALLALPQAKGQKAGGASDLEKTQQEAGAIAIPVTHLSLSAGKPAPGVGKSAVILQPVECTPKGDIVLQIPHPPDFNPISVVTLNLEGSHTFDLSTVQKLYDIRLLSVFPGDDGEVFLVNATADSTRSDIKMRNPQGSVITQKAWPGDHHSYLVLFGLDGVYKSTIDLPLGYDYRKAAALPSGEFLLLGYDSLNRIPRLQLVNAGGQQMRDLEIPAAFFKDDTLRKGAEAGGWEQAAATGSLATRWQFASVQGKVVLYQPHTKASALEVGAGGAVREVPIAAPSSGYVLDGFLQSSTRWLARFRRADMNKNSEGTYDTSGSAGKYVLVEFDPEDGSVKRSFDIGKDSLFNIACEADNSLKSYSVDLGSQFLIASTDLPR